MLSADKCVKCGKTVTSDEAALCKKLISRATEKYMCLDCTAEYFDVTKELLEDKIKQYKALGCTLFK